MSKYQTTATQLTEQLVWAVEHDHPELAAAYRVALDFIRTKASYISHIRAFAIKNYENGWDVVEEAYSDDEIWEVVKGAKNDHGALCLMITYMKPIISYRKEMMNSENW